MRHASAAVLLVMLGLRAAAPAKAAPVRFDFDGDGKDDPAVYRRETGAWYILQSSTHTVSQYAWGYYDATPVSGDFDGDGRAEVAVFAQGNATWSILNLASGATQHTVWGDPDAFPVPADYDGDGKTDLAVFYRTTGEWQIRNSATGTTRVQTWGALDPRPVPADYDGDGRDDLAYYVAVLGDWFILESSSGATRRYHLGRTEARPVPGDYDGDRKADIAVFDAPLARWQIRDSSTALGRTLTFGTSQSVAVPADYDGDHRTDLSEYRPAAGRWRIRQSGAGNAVREEAGAGLWLRAVQAYAHGAVENLRIHCHGDSITYGKGSSTDGPASGYPLLLEQLLEGAYGGDVTALNYGQSGESTGDGVTRLSWMLRQSHARVLLIMEGTNDHVFNRPFDTIESNLRSMVRNGQSMGLFVVIATIPPVVPSMRPEQYENIKAFNPRIYTIARDYHIPVAPVYEYITSVPHWDSTLMEHENGNHPNDTGYQYVRMAFVNALAPYLASADLR
ncbi:MAG: FG-GAP-like repeat-containing protein [Lentisphaerae bacterium]|nr:FG-GAP-like repeat-containing protein [Lentisphaerota bacterium]